MNIEKKVLPEYFQAIIDGKKKFELRLGDFDIKEGDILTLKEWDGEKYTGRKLSREVTNVAKFKIDQTFWSKEDIEREGLQIISFK